MSAPATAFPDDEPRQSDLYSQTSRPAPPIAIDRLLDRILESTEGQTPSSPWLEKFLQAPSLADRLVCLLSLDGRDPRMASKEEVFSLLTPLIAALDELLTRQINVILHHPRFQRLEASWRGLEYLVQQCGVDDDVKIRALSVTKKELRRDLADAIEFDQSQLFRKVYSDEFGMPGGEPFGLLLGDFEFANHPADMDVLRNISGVAASAFAPFVAAASPHFLGLDNFGVLERSPELAAALESVEYTEWKSFRESEDARFVGLTVPRVLMRAPDPDDPQRVDGFLVKEDTTDAQATNYLWGNAAYALGAVVIRAFAQGGWLADIRGFQRGVDGGGLVKGLPTTFFATDKHGIAPKCNTDVILSDRQEKELGELGFIPLCDCKDTPHSVFYGVQSVQKPRVYDRTAATMNARISAMLQYILCASRFAHYLKVIGRDKVGSFREASEVQTDLQHWIREYVSADDSAGPTVRARKPLREATVAVRAVAGRPGHYECTLRLAPHFQLDKVTAIVELKTEIAPAGNP